MDLSLFPCDCCCFRAKGEGERERERESKENIWVSHDGGRGGAPPPTSVGSLLSRREVKKGTGREKKTSKFFGKAVCVRASKTLQEFKCILTRGRRSFSSYHGFFLTFSYLVS